MSVHRRLGGMTGILPPSSLSTAGFRTILAFYLGVSARYPLEQQDFALGLTLGPQSLPNLGRAALRLTLRLGGAFQSARRAVVKTFAKPQIGAVPDLQLARAAAVAGPVGGIATCLAHALLAIAAVALFQADAIALALPAVELAVAVAPIAQIDTVMATATTVRPR